MHPNLSLRFDEKPKVEQTSKTPAQLPESNVEKVVELNDRLYFVNRMMKELPLHQHCKTTIKLYYK